jgi:RHS repeat-associated protein
MKKRSLGLVYSLSCFIIFLLVSIPFCLSIELNLTYDGNGNLITGDGKYREYNEFNQLIRIRNGTSVNDSILEEYVYHPTEDRILAKRVYKTYYYEYHAYDHLDETVIYVNDNLVRTVTYPAASQVNTSDKIYIKDESGIVAEFNSSQNKVFYSNDHLGSTGVLTNESGSVIEQTFYEPFGGIISGGNASRFYYEGKDYSQVISEYDFNFRKYSPELKFFVKPDSGVNNVYDPQGLNRYTFERNNPYKYVDPDGRSYYAPAILLGGIWGAVVGSLDYAIDYEGQNFNFLHWAGYTLGGGISGAGSTASDILALHAGGIGGKVISTLGGGTSELGGQLVQNAFTGKPLDTGLKSSFIIGSATSGISSFLPKIQYQRLTSVSKTPTTITGRKITAQNLISYLLSNQLRDIYNYYNSYVSGDLASGSVTNSNSGTSGSNNNSGDLPTFEDDYCSTHSSAACDLAEKAKG